MNNQQRSCEVLVIGAGPAGIAAACMASEAGKRVILLDNQPTRGGQIWRGGQSDSGAGENRHPARFRTTQGARRAKRWFTRLQASGARIFSGNSVFGQSESGAILAETAPPGPAARSLDNVGEFLWESLIIATGAREVFLPFPCWTLPGVIGPGGLHAMVKGGWPIADKRVVVAGSGPLLLAAAEGLQRHGARVVLIAEQAALSRVAAFGASLLRFPGKLAQGLLIKSALRGVPYRCGCWPLKAEGDGQVQSVTLTNGTRTWSERCDYLACGFHLVPNVELPMLLGCATANGRLEVNDFQETSIVHVFGAGECVGVGGADCALVEGQVAGLAAAGKPEAARALFGRRSRWHAFRCALDHAFALRPELKGLAAPDTIVCRCEDIRHAELSGFDSWRTAKLQTRCGMGPCQGRICGTAANILFGWQYSSVRPPLFPVSTGALLEIGSCPQPRPMRNTNTNDEPSTHTPSH